MANNKKSGSKSQIQKKTRKQVKKIKKNHKGLFAAIVVIVAILIVAAIIVNFYVMPLKDIWKKFFGSDSGGLGSRGENELRVHFVNVGQGDAIIIELPDGKNMIIDGGDNKTAVWNSLKGYIEDLNIKTFDYMMLTHTDADHVGSLYKVFSVTEVKKVYMPLVEDGVITTGVWNSFLTALAAEEGCTAEYSMMGKTIESQDDANLYRFTMLSPEMAQYDRLNRTAPNPSNSSYDKNDVSPIMLLEYMGKEIVFTGDANLPIEKQVIANYKSPARIYGDINLENIDLLKAGHHGSTGTGTSAQKTSGSTCKEFLELLKPKSVVICCGANNTHGHPHQDTLDRIYGLNIGGGKNPECYRTDNDGHVVATVFPDESKELDIYTQNTHDGEKNSHAPLDGHEEEALGFTVLLTKQTVYTEMPVGIAA